MKRKENKEWKEKENGENKEVRNIEKNVFVIFGIFLKKSNKETKLVATNY